jgi:hypothetical protein
MKAVGAALLSIGVLGCTPVVVKTDLTVRTPAVGTYAAGTNIVIGDFKDARSATRPEAEAGENGVLFYREWLRPHALVLNESPVKTLKKALQDLTQDAGFILAKDQGAAPASDIRVSGALTGFGAALAGSSRMVATVSFELTFERNGKVLATKRIKGEVSGDAYVDLQDVGLKLMKQAMDKALRRTASYLSSANFQEDVLGMKATKARAPEDDDAETKHDASR